MSLGWGFHQQGSIRWLCSYLTESQSLGLCTENDWKEGNNIDWWTKEEFGGVDRPFERAMITRGLLDQGLWRDLTANKRGAKFGIRAYHDPLAVP